MFAGIVTAKKFPWVVWPSVLALPLGWAVYVFWPSAPWILNLPAFFFTVSAILFLFPFAARNQEGQTEEAA